MYTIVYILQCHYNTVSTTVSKTSAFRFWLMPAVAAFTIISCCCSDTAPDLSTQKSSKLNSIQWEASFAAVIFLALTSSCLLASSWWPLTRLLRTFVPGLDRKCVLFFSHYAEDPLTVSIGAEEHKDAKHKRWQFLKSQAAIGISHKVDVIVIPCSVNSVLVVLKFCNLIAGQLLSRESMSPGSFSSPGNRHECLLMKKRSEPKYCFTLVLMSATIFHPDMQTYWACNCMQQYSNIWQTSRILSFEVYFYWLHCTLWPQHETGPTDTTLFENCLWIVL